MLDPEYIDRFTDAAQGAMDAYTLRLVCIYSALLGSIDFEGEGAYLEAAREAAKAEADAKKAMNKEGREAAREAARAAAEALAQSEANDLAAIGMTVAELSSMARKRLHNAARATVAGVQDIITRDNLKMPAAVQRNYLEVAAEAIASVNSGLSSYEDAVRRAVLELSRRGVSVIEYKSGARAQADVAMRRHVRTQVMQAGARNTLALMEETGHDLVQTSSHGGSRPEHAKWQGRVFSLSGKSGKYPDFRSSTGYGSVDGLCGANCKHSFGIYVEGRKKRYESDPDGGDEKRQERYEASQRQREIERNIRKYKRDSAALQAAGIDDTPERMKLAKWQGEQRAHLAKHPYLTRRYERENPYETQTRVYALTRQKVSRTAYMAHPNTKAIIRDAGVSQKRVGELVKASGANFETMAARDRRATLDAAIRRAKVEKRRDERVADKAANVVLPGKQNKHIPGTKEYRQQLEKVKREGVFPEPSALTVSVEEAQRLVDEYAGTGAVMPSRNGTWNSREVCEATRVIGYVVTENGDRIDTNRFTIHYAKNGVHIVPAAPREGQA